MRVWLVEDESMATRNLERLIAECASEMKIEKIIPSVEQAIRAFRSEELPALIFMDIQLADGLCFEIFREVEVHVPVIFTTAYDEYAIQAFETHAIAYLLKPVDRHDFEKALEKYRQYWKKRENPIARQLDSLVNEYLEKPRSTGKRFLVKQGRKYRSVPLEEIAYFSKDDLCLLHTRSGEKYPVDDSLSQLEKLLPDTFFRLNRQYLVHIDAVEEVISYSYSRLKVKLRPESSEPVMVSQVTAGKLKKWLGGA